VALIHTEVAVLRPEAAEGPDSGEIVYLIFSGSEKEVDV